MLDPKSKQQPRDVLGEAAAPSADVQSQRQNAAPSQPCHPASATRLPIQQKLEDAIA